MTIGTTTSYLLPPGAYDTHVHVFDSRIGPYHASRAYTPAEAPLDDLWRFLIKISQDGNTYPNVVVVQPSPYGTDNSVLLSVLRELQLRHPAITARGIAVVDMETVTNMELGSMHDLGVRGIRLNYQAHGRSVDTNALGAALQQAANHIKHLPGWKIQVFCPGHMWKRLYNIIVELPVEVIADHLGGLRGWSKLNDVEKQDGPLFQEGFDALVRLAQERRVLVKISGLYRSSSEVMTNHDDLSDVVSELARRIPDRLIWASDWPHTGDGSNRAGGKNIANTEAFRSVDDAGILRNLRTWLGSDEAWQKMMVENPKVAYI